MCSKLQTILSFFFVYFLFFGVYIIVAILFYKHFLKPPHNTVGNSPYKTTVQNLQHSAPVRLVLLSTAMLSANLALTCDLRFNLLCRMTPQNCI